MKNLESPWLLASRCARHLKFLLMRIGVTKKSPQAERAREIIFWKMCRLVELHSEFSENPPALVRTNPMVLLDTPPTPSMHIFGLFGLRGIVMAARSFSRSIHCSSLICPGTHSQILPPSIDRVPPPLLRTTRPASSLSLSKLSKSLGGHTLSL